MKLDDVTESLFGSTIYIEATQFLGWWIGSSMITTGICSRSPSTQSLIPPIPVAFMSSIVNSKLVPVFLSLKFLVS